MHDIVRTKVFIRPNEVVELSELPTYRNKVWRSADSDALAAMRGEVKGVPVIPRARGEVNSD